MDRLVSIESGFLLGAPQACELVNQYMEELASQWVYVKFVRLPASLSGVHVPSNQLPIISIYRWSKPPVNVFCGRSTCLFYSCVFECITASTYIGRDSSHMSYLLF